MAQRASTAAGRRRASARATTTASSPPKQRARKAQGPEPKRPKPKTSPKPKAQSRARAKAAAARPRHGERGIVAALEARRLRRAEAAPARPKPKTKRSAAPTAAKSSATAGRAPRVARAIAYGLAAPLRGLARILPAARGARIAVIVMVVAALGSAYHFWLRDSSLLGIDEVKVEGLSGPDGPAIAAALTKSAEGMTTLNADSGTLEQAVADFPVVRSVEIDTGLPTSATISVTETPPAMIARVDGDEQTDVPVASDGTLLPGAATEGLDLPVMNLSKPPQGDELADAALEQALVIGAAPDPLRPMIETIGYSTGDGVSVGLEGDVELEFGASDHARWKWSSAAAVMADPELTQLASIDLRVPERPAVG